MIFGTHVVKVSLYYLDFLQPFTFSTKNMFYVWQFFKRKWLMVLQQKCRETRFYFVYLGPFQVNSGTVS
jgi:hypothetical protein